MRLIQLLSEEEWLKERRNGIGASEIGKVMGVSPWGSPLSVYLEKVEGIEKEKNIAMEVGLALEPALRKFFIRWMKENEGIDIEIPAAEDFIGPALYAHADHPLVRCSPDGIFYHPVFEQEVGVEYKTASEWSKDQWEGDGLPDDYYLQCQQSLAVTGYQYWYIAYLIGNREFNAKRVPRNEAIISMIIEQINTFWAAHVIPKAPPPPGGLEADTAILGKLYQAQEDSTIDLSHMQEAYDKYKALSEQEKDLKKQKDALKQQFMFEMKENTLGLVNGKKVRWGMVAGFEVKARYQEPYRKFQVY